MDARLQRRVQRYGWDKASRDYERYWRQQLAPAQARLLAPADLRPGERGLDVACGTGLVAFPAAHALGPGGAGLGTDISQDMGRRAARAAAGLGTAHATFARQD